MTIQKSPKCSQEQTDDKNQYAESSTSNDGSHCGTTDDLDHEGWRNGWSQPAHHLQLAVRR
jgi:hypothetical protein